MAEIQVVVSSMFLGGSVAVLWASLNRLGERIRTIEARPGDFVSGVIPHVPGKGD
jgi:hypothetical protein